MKRTAEDSAAQAKKNAAKQTQAAAAPAAQFNPTDAKQISMMLDAFKGLGILEKQILNLLGYPDMTYLQAEDMVKLKSLASDIRKNPAVKANVFGGNHG